MDYQLRYAITLVAAVALAACGDDPIAPITCETEPLPFSQSADGPVITDVVLEVDQVGVVLAATATDPQGSENLRDVVQRIGVYRNTDCDGTPITLQDDLAGSGVEETFGAVLSVNSAWDLYNDMSARDRWPVHVEFRDVDGNVTTGRVLARVVITTLSVASLH